MSSENQNAKPVPKDAEVMIAILKDMGVTDYEPRIVNQMLEFTYKYVTDVLEDAEAYCGHAGRQELDVEDVKLAIQTKLDHAFTVPPPRDFLLEIAKQKNSLPLPAIKPQNGARLPPERYCLTSSNYRLKPPQKKTTLTMPSKLSKFPSSSSMAILTKPGGSSFNVKPSSNTTLSVSHGLSSAASQSNSRMGMINLTSSSSQKRKREEEEA